MLEALRRVSDNFLIKTVTNGMALNHTVRSKLLHSSLNEIEISLDGESAEESEEIRRKSSSQKIIENVTNLIAERSSLSSNLKISIATTQFLKSKEDLPHWKELAKITPQWLNNLFGEDVQYKSCIAMRWPHMNVGNEYELLWGRGEDKDVCDHTLNTITIRSDGSVVPCCYDLTSQLVMGNIMAAPLEQIFSGSRFNALRESIATKEYQSICKNCNTVRPPVFLKQRENNT